MDVQHDSTRSASINLFARLLNGETKTLTFFTPQVSSFEIKTRLFQITNIPIPFQRLIHSGHQLTDDSILSSPDTTVHLCLRLRGGKGGFGSLLRGAATKAGQKKTNNFDACRDMSGRRLRHVNAEKKLEEWKAEEEERRLEKIAEEFLKKTAKNGKKGAGDGEAQKYVAKYREESAKCVQQVEMCLKEVIGSSSRNGKRRPGIGGDGDSKSKKLKIWMGKGKLGESDTDDSDESGSEDEEENEKSTVLNNENDLGSQTDREDSPSSVTGGKQDGELSAPGSSGSHSEEEKDMLVSSSSAMCTSQESVSGEEDSQIIPEKLADTPSTASETEAAEGAKEHGKYESGHTEDAVGHMPGLPDSEGGRNVEALTSGFSSSGDVDEPNPVKQNAGEDKPLNFDDFNAAEEMEVLGLERLKVELQTRGLKCGGTLQERAARLFLLKSTPLDKIPKKHLAKKVMQLSPCN